MMSEGQLERRKESFRARSRSTESAVTRDSVSASSYRRGARGSASATPYEALNLPVIYTAILSQVAMAFRAILRLDTHVKDSLEYKDSFTGAEAVDTLAYIIKTTDRNLAILIGRALESQKFFHDVHYNHRLRDSPHELYQFSVSISSIRLARGITAHSEINMLEADGIDSASPNNEPTPLSLNFTDDTPVGVFTLLTDCYSPTCTREKLCYSIACPRRLEQQTRVSNQVTQLHRGSSNHNKLWSAVVPEEVLASTSDKERKRQEIIYEIIHTEQEFVADLALVQNLYVKRLKESDIVPDTRRDDFVKEVFLNIGQIHAINSKLCRQLLARQSENYIVSKIGDIFLGVVNEFSHFVEYGAKQVYAKNTLDVEIAQNPDFAKLLQEVERHPDSRRLPIQSFLGRPVTRMGRYPLLLENVLKYTSEEHPDQLLISNSIKVIRDVLQRINTEAGKADNILKLARLHHKILWPPGEYEDLQLTDPSRLFVRDGTMTFKKAATDLSLHIFLFDHCLLLTKVKKTGFKVFKKPIPLELLVLGTDRTVQANRQSALFLKVTLDRRESSKDIRTSSTATAPKSSSSLTEKGFPVTVIHLGRFGGTYTLYASSHADRRAWREAIDKQSKVLVDSQRIFEVVTLVDTNLTNHSKVNCSAAIGSRLILGTDNGLWLGPENSLNFPTDIRTAAFQHVLELEKVTQIEVLQDFETIAILAASTLWTFPLDLLNEGQQEAAQKRSKKITSPVSFFKLGAFMGKTVICTVRSTTLSSTIKIFEPVDQGNTRKKANRFAKLFRSGGDSMKILKEFYIPAESSTVYFLKNKLCVGSQKGFEVVDLETLSSQELLDPQDESLNQFRKRDNLKSIAIFRVRDGEFLLCYPEFAFYVNKLGKHTNTELLINWSGAPTAFAYVPPYVLAFDPTFIEVRHVDTGILSQVIPVTNLRPLNIDSSLIHGVSDTAFDSQSIFRVRPRSSDSHSPSQDLQIKS
ncbi:CNH domain-containing protein [Polychytrium aggregatum]|uniref:CNH domain-containing protein n=1 Tax=Polychytrium aggregatum TaxID=110093 RepID=UPI0022FE997E|nr:CNH domain-containing protein [Polychytrium aggregatum]KAI9205831.1 CNH domain-containing protein [Polychytrium aggregatum]